jgi:hypothetical protein
MFDARDELEARGGAHPGFLIRLGSGREDTWVVFKEAGLKVVERPRRSKASLGNWMVTIVWDAGTTPGLHLRKRSIEECCRVERAALARYNLLKRELRLAGLI